MTLDPDGNGRVEVHVDVARVGTDVPLLVTARVGELSVTGKVTEGADSAVVELVVPQPARWFPRGYGEPALHELTVTLATTDEVPLDTFGRRIGFRTVELDTAPDEIGERFAIVVNGEPVLVKGANWIPDDSFPTRVDRARYAARIAQATDANLNLLRVWGGGLYESEDFYELCDAAGVLVWRGLPVRLRGLPGGGAARDRGRGGGPRAGRPPGAASEPGAVERQQREHRGLALLGLAARRRRPHLGSRLLPRAVAEDRRRGRPDPPVLAGVALQRLDGPRPARRPLRHQAHLGRVEPP
ncbi:hypothetical protein ACFQX7_37280 [Luedemannella flava]